MGGGKRAPDYAQDTFLRRFRKTAAYDPEEDGSPEHPFSQIQQAMDTAAPGDRVLVQPGTYKGDGNKNLDFAGKAITVESTGGFLSHALNPEDAPSEFIRIQVSMEE